MCVHKTNWKSCTCDPSNVLKIGYCQTLNNFFLTQKEIHAKSTQTSFHINLLSKCFYFVKNIITELFKKK